MPNPCPQSSKRCRAQRPLSLEQLEHRRVLATFGTPWPEPRSLSVSFPTDQAAIGAYNNSIREVFDQVADRREWQEAALRAFQAWSVFANINVGLVPDRGDAFGAVGLTSNDPRFGEMRIGAFPQPGVLANAAPYQQRAGTWSGDVLLNTQANYFLGDWNSTSPINVPSANERGPAVELYSVLLHEAGNALGIADNSVAGAVMNGTYSRPNGTLKSSDIVAIRALYGSRTDVYEPVNNNTTGRATRIFNPPGFNGSEPLSVPGSLNSQTDVDVYRFQPLRNQEKVTVRLWASGISLVKAKLEILDRNGNKLADVKADSIFENNLSLEMGSLQDHTLLFIRVAKNTNDVFAIGDYRLELDYRPSDLQPSVVPPSHDADAEDEDDREIDYVSVDALFDQYGLLDNEVGTNDRLATAIPLETTPGFLEHTRYELSSAIASASDRDLWSFRSPSFASPLLQVTVDPVGAQNPIFEAIVLTQTGDRVAASETRKADGGLSIDVVNPSPNQNYMLFVRTQAGSQIVQGNYVVTVDFSTNPATSMRDVTTGRVTATEEHLFELIVPKTQLFRFDLLGSSVTVNSGVQLSLYDAMTGDIVSSFATSAASTRREYVWLTAGSYIVRATARAASGTLQRPVSFRLRADVISDDQGPNPMDPTRPPLVNTQPDFILVPINPLIPPPAIDFVEPPFENPWSSDAYRDFFADYYRQVLA